MLLRINEILKTKFRFLGGLLHDKQRAQCFKLQMGFYYLINRTLGAALYREDGCRSCDDGKARGEDDLNQVNHS